VGTLHQNRKGVSAEIKNTKQRKKENIFQSSKTDNDNEVEKQKR
jgi:hypothetical protein